MEHFSDLLSLIFENIKMTCINGIDFWSVLNQNLMN